MNKKGFSLIELSIVFIIFGLLISAVIAGITLIDSTKIRGSIAKVNDLRASFYTFFSINSRLPGDIDNDGVIGVCNGHKCSIAKQDSSTKFGGEYYGKDVSHQVGPWVDLYLEKLSSFKPKITENLDIESLTCDGVGDTRPYFENIKNSCIKGFKTFYGQSGKTDGYHLNIYSINSNSGLDGKILKKLDDKADDGLPASGNIQADCSNYNDKCIEIFYNFYNKL